LAAVVLVELISVAAVEPAVSELSQVRPFLLQLMQSLSVAVEQQPPAVMAQAEQQLH
jgi:hypothetical protein